MTPVTVMPRDAVEWTVDDLDQLPDDGLRYELLDGTLLVSPAPTRRHQRAALELGALTAHRLPAVHGGACSRHWIGGRTIAHRCNPTVLVLDEPRSGTSPAADSMILAVEVLSPSTRRKDVVLKRSKYEDSGVPHYWIVDPDAPSIIALELVDGHYVTVGEAIGDGRLSSRSLSPSPLSRPN